MKNEIMKNEQATGKSPEPAGRNACPTSDAVAQPTVRPANDRPRAERYNVADRKELVVLFEDYGLLVAGFEGLRSDAYEKRVAAESPAKLEQIYEALLDPGLGFKEVRERCPVWPAGSRQAGKLPSMMTLREIKERILLEWKVRDRMKHDGFVERLQEVGLDDEQMMAAASMILGEELLSAKFNGTPISENLRVLDRMLRIAGLKLRWRNQRDAGPKMEKAQINHRGTENIQAPTRVAGQESKPTETVREPVTGNKILPAKPNEVAVKASHEPLDWLPALQKKDSLVDLIMESGGKARG